jgi:hypothetical protein
MNNSNLSIAIPIPSTEIQVDEEFWETPTVVLAGQKQETIKQSFESLLYTNQKVCTIADNIYVTVNNIYP